MKRILLALALALTFVMPAQAAPLPDFAITSSQPGTVGFMTAFDHTYTVTNVGTVAGKYMTEDFTNEKFTFVSVEPAVTRIGNTNTWTDGCAQFSRVLRGRKTPVSINCTGTLQPGESVTITEHLKTKYWGFHVSLFVNDNPNLYPDGNPANNSAPWAVNTPLGYLQ